jgi:anti-sigma regulatory factor (Ser/Thr protein kinase)
VEAEFDVAGEAVGGEVHVSVADNGRWRPARGRNRGRGLDLMRELMDDVEVDSGEDGTIVRMRRRLGGGGT